MGFSVVEGPEVELDHYNFEMLNIPSGHPARDMWNSLWINQEDENGNRPLLMRTHTSPMQARVMESTEPPIRVIVPGKCYRYEATDATHEWHFYQIEGLAVDEGITFANLKGTLYELIRDAGYVEILGGSRSWGQEWYIPKSFVVLDMIRKNIRGSLLEWDPNVLQC